MDRNPGVVTISTGRTKLLTWKKSRDNMDMRLGRKKRRNIMSSTFKDILNGSYGRPKV